jgi:hypothetical protein
MLFDSSCHPPCFLPSSIYFVTNSFFSVSSSYEHLFIILFYYFRSSFHYIFMSFLFPFLNLLAWFSSPFLYFLLHFDIMIGRRPKRPRIHGSISMFFILSIPDGAERPYGRPLLPGNNEDGREDNYSDSVPRLRMRGVLHQSVIQFHCVMLNYKQGQLYFHPFFLAPFTLSVSILLPSRCT